MSTSLEHLFTNPVLRQVGRVADSMHRQAYVVGGYVRDMLLQRPCTDIDFVTVGSGIDLARAVAHSYGPRTRVDVFRSYGTAKVQRRGMELEFVGARRESYSRDSRNPIVEDGTLDDDIARRDFTINAMAVCINDAEYGTLVDNYNGIADLNAGIIRTPLDPDITFSDDPLRMMRAVRFATQLNFDIHPTTLAAIRRNADRLQIIKKERIAVELQKIMASPKPSIGWNLMLQTGLLNLVLPELVAMKGVENVNGRGHKDNFDHTMQVLDNVATATDSLPTRWGALLHDIGKPITKRWDKTGGWTFHNHNFVGAKMVPGIFERLKLPGGASMRKTQKLVELHMRPIALVEDEVTDSAVRRLINYAEDDLHDLMILARADITSKNQERKQRFLDNFDLVDEKIATVTAKDEDAKFRPALDGNDVRAIFDLPQCPQVGFFMQNLTRVSKDCEIEPTRAAALDYLLQLGRTVGLEGNPSAITV